MEKEQLLLFFEEKYSQMKDMILSITIWSDDPDENLCKTMAEGLQILANSGNKKAAALYCATAAYDNNEDTFSEDIAVNLVFTADAVEEYHKLVEDEFYSIVDAEYYDYLYAFPAVHFMRNVSGDQKFG